MWIIVATVLLLYLLGFLFICFLNADGSPSSSDNNFISASNNNDDMENLCERHHLSRYHRPLLSRLLSSNFRFDEEEPNNNRQMQPRNANGGPGRDLSVPSALFAHREQQLRQIHHEINEMSYLLGASQTQSDERSRPVPVPNLSRTNFVQPLRNLSSTNNYLSGSGSRSRYSFVHQLMSPFPASCSPSSLEGAVEGATGAGEAVTVSASTCSSANNIIPNSSSSTSTPGGSITYHSCGSSSLPYSPSGSESCHIFQERQRRLRHIRMELEGLSLQLSQPNDQRVGGGTTPTSNLLHGTPASASRNSVVMGVSPPSAGTAFGLEPSMASASSLIYFGRGGNGSNSIINGSSWYDDNDDDDLPGYESIVCLLDSNSSRVDDSGTAGGVEQGEGTPPPSYNEALHLYSFGERKEKEK